MNRRGSKSSLYLKSAGRPIDRDEVKILRTEGKNVLEIAGILNCSLRSVKRILKDLGLK